MSKTIPIATIVIAAATAWCDRAPFAHLSLKPSGTPTSALEDVPRLGQEYERLGYALGWDKEKRVPRWVAYRLKKEDLTHQFPRDNSFRRDFAVSNSPDEHDYAGTDFDRGHMAPANDMEYDSRIMKDSFYMSNMCPQYSHVNRSAWKGVEGFVRNAAMRFGEVLVVTGPVFPERGGDFGNIPMKNEGKKIETAGGDITVPEAFFKVLYTPARGGMMLAFLVPNDEDVLGNYLTYVRPVSLIERLSGSRFFADERCAVVDSDDEERLKDMDRVDLWF